MLPWRKKQRLAFPIFSETDLESSKSLLHLATPSHRASNHRGGGSHTPPAYARGVATVPLTLAVPSVDYSSLHPTRGSQVLFGVSVLLLLSGCCCVWFMSEG